MKNESLPIKPCIPSCWQPGDAILLRGVWHKMICFAIPARIVQDTPGLTAFYWSAGTPNKNYPRKFDALEFLHLDHIDLKDGFWTRTDVLLLIPPEAAHAVYAMWETGTRVLRCWYVNLQAPLQRTSLGYDTMDYLLDIVISPDLTSWCWKDEDQFDDAISVGLFSEAEALAIRREGERVLVGMGEATSLFTQGWDNWQPPADWTTPSIPPNWDNIE